jgi:acyl-CoA reductase-like NAD-dependent aldehyde dehydrogenase
VGRDRVRDTNLKPAIFADDVFGPVTSILSFHSLDEALGYDAALGYGMALSVWTKSINKACTQINS